MAGKPVAASLCCGPTGVPGAGGPGRCVCRWAAARLIDGVACSATGVPGAGGPGRCVCRWAAARPRAVRAASLWLGASSRSPARPRRRPPTPRQVPPAPFTPAALCRWSVAGCVVSKPGQAPPPPTGTAARPWTLGGLLVLQSFWGVRLRVVTNVVNPSSFLCGVLSGCYKRRQSDGFFVENGGFGA